MLGNVIPLCVLEEMVVTPSPQVSSECVVCLSHYTMSTGFFHQ